MKAMKIIASAIISKELGNYLDTKIYVLPITNFEYYTQFFKFYIDNKLNLDKNEFLDLIKTPFENELAGFYKLVDCREENSKNGFIICILMSKIKKSKFPNRSQSLCIF